MGDGLAIVTLFIVSENNLRFCIVLEEYKQLVVVLKLMLFVKNIVCLTEAIEQ